MGDEYDMEAVNKAYRWLVADKNGRKLSYDMALKGKALHALYERLLVMTDVISGMEINKKNEQLDDDALKEGAATLLMLAKEVQKYVVAQALKVSTESPELIEKPSRASSFVH